MRAFLRILGSAWMAFAHVIGRINTILILTLFYFVILLPFGLIARLISLVRGKQMPQWIKREEEHPSLEILRRPF